MKLIVRFFFFFFLKDKEITPRCFLILVKALFVVKYLENYLENELKFGKIQKKKKKIKRELCSNTENIFTHKVSPLKALLISVVN